MAVITSLQDSTAQSEELPTSPDGRFERDPSPVRSVDVAQLLAAAAGGRHCDCVLRGSPMDTPGKGYCQTRKSGLMGPRQKRRTLLRKKQGG